jgi:hypothetical protein
MAAINERNRKWWVVVAMALATILITIDFGGVMIILPAIGREPIPPQRGCSGRPTPTCWPSPL